MNFYFLLISNHIVKYFITLIFIIALYITDLIFNLEILTTTLYAMDSSQEVLLKINETINYWQCDINNLNEYKEQLTRKYQIGLLSSEQYNHEIKDVQEQIVQGNKNVSDSIKEKGQILKSLNIDISSSCLGKNKKD